jgi:uncharacterized alkaline shock family protein YloU
MMDKDRVEKNRVEKAKGGKPKRAAPGRKTPAGGGVDRLDVDRVTVTDGALATIIGLAAHEVPGVVGMAPAGIREGIKRILGVSQADEGVEVRREDEATTVDLHVVVAYGVNIPAVADSIRERVVYAAEAFAGVGLKQVRVHIDGVSRDGVGRG